MEMALSGTILPSISTFASQKEKCWEDVCIIYACFEHRVRCYVTSFHVFMCFAAITLNTSELMRSVCWKCFNVLQTLEIVIMVKLCLLLK